MKKLLTAFFLFCASLNFAQITLEHTYPAQVYVTQIAANDWNYYSQSGSNLNIYDISHSLIKTISIPSVSGWTTEGASYISTNLFNTDSYYEYSVLYYNSTTYTYRTTIYNELGTQLLQSDSSIGCSCFNTSAGIKMIINHNAAKAVVNQIGDVYSLGGNYLAADVPVENNGKNDFALANPFPNPSNTTIHLAYELPIGTEKAEMVISNISGQVVKTCNVGNAFTDILLDTKQYAPGEYIYYIHTDNYTSQTNKFIISH